MEKENVQLKAQLHARRTQLFTLTTRDNVDLYSIILLYFVSTLDFTRKRDYALDRGIQQ